MVAASGECLCACACDMQAKPAAINESDATLMAGVGREGSARLQRRKAEAPCEALALRWLAGDFQRGACTVAPWHGGVSRTREIASMLGHENRISSGVDSYEIGNLIQMRASASVSFTQVQ